MSHFSSLLSHRQSSNARINRARQAATITHASRMKAMLFALRLNELLGCALGLCHADIRHCYLLKEVRRAHRTLRIILQRFMKFRLT